MRKPPRSPLILPHLSLTGVLVALGFLALPAAAMERGEQCLEFFSPREEPGLPLRGQDFSRGASLTPVESRLARKRGPRSDIEKAMLDLRRAIKKGLTTDERLSRTREISKRIVRELEGQGFKAEIFRGRQSSDPAGYSYRVRILEIPDDAPDAKMLKAVQSKYGGTFTFTPYLDPAEPGITGMVMGKGDISIPIHGVETGLVGGDRVALHEIGHHVWEENLKRGKPTPYYYEFTARAGRKVTDVQFYDAYMSGEELRMYHREMRHAQPRSTGGPPRVPEALPIGQREMATPQDIAKFLKPMSEAAIRLIRESRAAIDRGIRPKFGTDPDNGRIFATIPLVRKGAEIGTAKYWLVDSPGVRRGPANLALLRQYLETVERAAEMHLRSAREVLAP